MRNAKRSFQIEYNKVVLSNKRGRFEQQIAAAVVVVVVVVEAIKHTSTFDSDCDYEFDIYDEYGEEAPIANWSAPQTSNASADGAVYTPIYKYVAQDEYGDFGYDLFEDDEYEYSHSSTNPPISHVCYDEFKIETTRPLVASTLTEPRVMKIEESTDHMDFEERFERRSSCLKQSPQLNKMILCDLLKRLVQKERSRKGSRNLQIKHNSSMNYSAHLQLINAETLEQLNFSRDYF
jgi:hypothetical protein